MSMQEKKDNFCGERAATYSCEAVASAAATAALNTNNHLNDLLVALVQIDVVAKH